MHRGLTLLSNYKTIKTHSFPTPHSQKNATTFAQTINKTNISNIGFRNFATASVSRQIEEPPSVEIKMQGDGSRSIYLDMQATTPIDPRVLDAMMPHFTESYGNPHSRTHDYGKEAMEVVEVAREQVANLINADAKEIIFTSGATESNNIALKGAARFYSKSKTKPKKHIVTTVIEHKCVLDSCRVLEQEGFEVTYLPVQKNGLVDLEQFKNAIREDTIMCSVMAVNNEIGVIQPLAEIGKICRGKGVFFHTDCAQALGKIPLDVDAMNIDLMSMSGHKIYGPKGVGALYVRRKPKVRLEALQSGGGQERGFRSGTLPTPLIVGLGEACAVAGKEMKRDEEHVGKLFNRLYTGIQKNIPHVYLNGDLTARIHGNLNISFAFVEGESLLLGLKGLVACSSGSACTSESLEPSYVLRALGVEEDLAHTSIRFGLGRFTTEKEVDFTIDRVGKVVSRLRELSPLYDMFNEGIDLKSIQWTQDK